MRRCPRAAWPFRCVGNPRNESVRMGSFVNRAQRVEARSSLAHLTQQAGRLFDGAAAPLVGADPAVACCIGLTLLGVKDADAVGRIHDTAVFGPFARLVPHRDARHGLQRCGGGRVRWSLRCMAAMRQRCAGPRSRSPTAMGACA